VELLRALGQLAEPPGDGHHRLAGVLDLPERPDDAAFTDTFILQLYPYASVYVGAEGMLGGAARDRVAGFFRTLGAAPPSESDHLAVLLGAAADIADHEATAVEADAAAAWRRSRAALLWEHLLSWVPPFADRVIALAGPYAAWARLLLDALRHEADVVGPAPALPLHLRAAPRLDDPRDGAEERAAEVFRAHLLAPVRTGVILTRTDLLRAARDLGLGARIGERRFVLSALLAQAPDAVLDWLADEADQRATAHSAHAWTGSVATFWADRAAATATLLRELGADARSVTAMASQEG
jgi:hypothetical protein